MSNPIYQTRAWKALSRKTLERDKWRCQIGLPGCKGAAVSADHIIELEDGGAPFDESNLQAACRSCNTAKRNRRVAARAKRSVRSW